MTKRKLYTLSFICSALLLLLAYYFQYAQKLTPCPLCIMQRFCFYGVMALSLIAALHNPNCLGAKIYSFLLMLCSGFGLYFAGRQVWIQHFPDSAVAACPASFKFMLQNFPLQEILNVLFQGSGDCAAITWHFLGLSMAEWSLFFLLGFFFGAAYLFINTVKAARRA
jgi:disulfide bond formation protein DsbB